jgi:hypothetical protein
VSLRNRRHDERMRGRWGRKTMPDEVNPRLWSPLVPGYPILPITELHRDWLPTHWDTPEYKQDVPKR